MVVIFCVGVVLFLKSLFLKSGEIEMGVSIAP
jgi:hypothetical protein